MFVKNAISIFVGMQINSVLSAAITNPLKFENPNLLFKPIVSDDCFCHSFTVRTTPRINDIRFDYQIESLNNEHDRTFTYASLRRKPLPD
ncbi:hypothetical protein CENTIMANUS_00099 [Klebsiella phage vB_KpM_Centimanus]